MVERIRGLAENSFNIRWSQHARDRMDERGITSREALETIRGGEIFGKIVPDDDEWKVTLKRRRAGRVVQVVLAVSDGGDLTVVTVM